MSRNKLCVGTPMSRNTYESEQVYESEHLCNRTFFLRSFNEKSKILKNSPYDFHKILQSLYTQRCSCLRYDIKTSDWKVRNIAKISPKMTENKRILDFFDFLKYSLKEQVEKTFMESFYTMLWSYVCSLIKIERLGFERVRKKKSKADSFTTYEALV